MFIDWQKDDGTLRLLLRESPSEIRECSPNEMIKMHRGADTQTFVMLQRKEKYVLLRCVALLVLMLSDALLHRSVLQYTRNKILIILELIYYIHRWTQPMLDFESQRVKQKCFLIKKKKNCWQLLTGKIIAWYFSFAITCDLHIVKSLFRYQKIRRKIWLLRISIFHTHSVWQWDEAIEADIKLRTGQIFYENEYIGIWFIGFGVVRAVHLISHIEVSYRRLRSSYHKKSLAGSHGRQVKNGSSFVQVDLHLCPFLAIATRNPFVFWLWDRETLATNESHFSLSQVNSSIAFYVHRTYIYSTDFYIIIARAFYMLVHVVCICVDTLENYRLTNDSCHPD